MLSLYERYSWLNKPIQHIRNIFWKDTFNTLERKKLMAKYVEPSCVIVDAGAHQGEDSIQFSQVFPHARIIGFEPVLAMFQKAKEHIHKYPMIEVHPFGLGNENANASIFTIQGFEGSSSLFDPITEGHPLFNNKKVEKEAITLIRLEDWCSQNGIDQVDILCLDLQGYEYNALLGFEKYLRKVSVIHLEVFLIPSYENQPLFNHVHDYLVKLGFSILKKYFYYKDHGDVIYINDKY